MPKVVAPLSDTQVKNAKPKPKNNPKQYRISDGNGLYLQVSPKGSKIWLFNFQRPHTKERTNISLGRYDEVTLSEAREELAKYRKLLAKNIDPRDFRREEEEKALLAKQNNLQAVVDEWIEIEKDRITPAYAEDVYNSLVNHILPKLGKKPVHLITAPETISILRPLAAQGKLEMDKRLCQRLNSVMDYSI
ncbi:MAG: integrase arm-type DNA-binding domain-containing protein, partial [Proteobacteria bacterium]|nr:integrase arm-type DNA-binding domain-containing protein [Pseudomonadota bacterium]